MFSSLRKILKQQQELRQIVKRQTERQRQDHANLRELVDKVKSLEKHIHELLKNQKDLIPFYAKNGEELLLDKDAQPFLLEEYQNLLEQRQKNLVSVTQPMVLISQVHRSGGTLLSQLFDGHPELHCHPFELHTGYPDKTQWPTLSVEESPTEWFRKLSEPSINPLFRDGYVKPGRNQETTHEVKPFLLMPLLLRNLFLSLAAEGPAKSAREIMNTYMTAYFNAWVDNQNLHGQNKKWITAFVPRLCLDSSNIDQFFKDYPDGKLIQILREPKSWYRSNQVHVHARPEEIKTHAELWIKSAESMHFAKENYGEKVMILRFEDLITSTKDTMTKLCGFLGIAYHSILLEPTFNLLPMKANSSFPVKEAGVVSDPLNRELTLTEQEREVLDDLTLKPYEAALNQLCDFPVNA